MISMDQTKLDELKARYRALCHGMQTGVATVMSMNLNKEATPKHLRTGVNSAMVEHAALALLLMKKGVITEEEYYEALVERMAAEVESYRAMISEATGGAGVTLL